jgi:hypothetical protein
MNNKVPLGRSLSARFNGGRPGFEGLNLSDERRLAAARRNASFYGAVASENAVDALNSNFTAKYVITNGLATPARVVLCPGYFGSLAEINASRKIAADAILAEGEMVVVDANHKLTAKGEPYNISELLNFAKLNPLRFTHLKVTVDQAEQLENNIEIIFLSPFRSMGDARITPANYKTASQTNDKIADISLPDFQMSDQILMYTTILPGRQISFLWSVGAIKNSAAELQEDFKRYEKVLAKAVAE